MASRFWIGGTGNINDTAHWSASSGGAGGASVPVAGDDAIFDANSGAGSYTITRNATINCRHFNMGAAAGTPTLTGAGGDLVLTGNLTLKAGMIWNSSGAVFFAATSGTQVITTNGVALTSANWRFSGTSPGVVQLGDDLLLSGTTGFGYSTLAITMDFDPNGKTVTVEPGLSSCSLTTRTSGLTFFNLHLIGNATKTGVVTILANGPIIVTNSLKYLGNSAVNRLLIRTGGLSGASGSLGSPATIQAAAIDGTSDFTDFQDITAAGAAAPFATGSSIGDAQGNSNITFTAPVTRYWVGNAGSWDSTTKWAATSGGASGASVPLCHDNVFIDANSITLAGQTLQANNLRLCKNLVMTGVLNTPTINFVNASHIFGDLILATNGVTGGTIGFYGRQGITVTPGSVPLVATCEVRAPGGTVTLGGALVPSGSIRATWSVIEGTLALGNFSHELNRLIANVGNVARSLDFGNSNVILRPFNTIPPLLATATGCSVVGGGSHITVDMSTLAGTGTFTNTGNLSTVTFNDVTFIGNLGSGITIDGPQTFNTFTAAPGTTIMIPSTNGTRTATTWAISGTGFPTDKTLFARIAASFGDWTTPDSAPLSVTGDLELQVDMVKAIGPGGIIAKGTTLTANGYRLFINPGTVPVFQWGDGSLRTATCSTTWPHDSIRAQLKMEFDGDNGAGGCDVKFYQRLNDAAAWVQLGTTITQAFTSGIVDNSNRLQVGSNTDTTGGFTFNGAIYRARVLAGIGGSVVGEFKPEGQYTNGNTFVSSDGATYTGGESAAIVHAGMTVIISSTSQKSLTKAGGGTVGANHIALRRSTAIPANTFYVGPGSFDIANNVDWTFGSPVSFAGTSVGTATVAGTLHMIWGLTGTVNAAAVITNGALNVIYGMNGLSQGVATALAQWEPHFNYVPMTGFSQGFATVHGMLMPYPKSRIYIVKAEGRAMQVSGAL